MLQLNRDYSIAEAAELTERTVDDLIYAAADGRLQIHVMANRWTASRIYQVSSVESPGVSFRVDRPAAGSRNADGNDAEDHDVCAADQLDITTGRTTIFGRQGPTKSIYQVELDGLQPVASRCFGEFRRDPNTAQIEIDLNKALHTPNKDAKLFFCPAPPLLVSEALLQGQLVVMASDLSTMLGQDDAAQFADLQDDPRWPELLGIALHAWQSVSRDIKDGERPRVELEKWLRTRYGHLSKEAVRCIATIANWDKGPGRRKKVDGE